MNALSETIKGEGKVSAHYFPPVPLQNIPGGPAKYRINPYSAESRLT
jgi:hypothetical protein